MFKYEEELLRKVDKGRKGNTWEKKEKNVNQAFVNKEKKKIQWEGREMEKKKNEDIWYIGMNSLWWM